MPSLMSKGSTELALLIKNMRERSAFSSEAAAQLPLFWGYADIQAQVLFYRAVAELMGQLSVDHPSGQKFFSHLPQFSM